MSPSNQMTAADMYKSLTALQTENQYRERHNLEDVTRGWELLNKLPEESVNIVSKKYPILQEICTYSVEQLLKHENYEIEKIQNLRNELYEYITVTLAQLEEQLC